MPRGATSSEADEPGALAGLIPDDYEGETLKIWRFHQMPPKA